MTYGKRLQKFWDSLPEDEKEEVKQELEGLKVEYSSLQAMEVLKENVPLILKRNEELREENRILNIMIRTSDPATGIINDQNLHRLLLKFYDLFTEHFAPEDEFKIDVDFDPEDEINEDRIAITVLTKSDDIEGYLDKYFLVYKKLDEARKLLAPECKHVGFSVQYTE
jgi:hypothetical protein